MKMNSVSIVESWLVKTIIGLNLCPFAKRPFENQQIRIESTVDKTDEGMIDFFLSELDQLQKSKNITTSLVIFENASKDFQQFYNLCGLFEDLLVQLKLQEEFQIVCFHPKFRFEGENEDQRVNYVNRSPFPLIHILYAEEVTNALKSPEEGEQISFNNGKTLNELSDQEFEKHFPSTFYSI